MKIRFFAVIAIISTVLMAQFKAISAEEIAQIKKNAAEYECPPAKADEVYVMRTNLGELELRLFPDVAPLHANNFKKLGLSGFYNGTSFHRVIKDFMIQGGDILSRDDNPANDGTGNPGWSVNAEFNDLPHFKGRLSMARAQDPNSAGSQFFIVGGIQYTPDQLASFEQRSKKKYSDEAKEGYATLGGTPHLDYNYTVFGEVVKNVSLVDRIINTETEKLWVQNNTVKEIPKGENQDDYVSIRSGKGNAWMRIPEDKTASEFNRELRRMSRSDKPVENVFIEKIYLKK